jgi:hypothetical protein
MPRYSLNYAGAFHHTQYVVAAGEPPARYLESNLPVIHLLMTIPGEPMILPTPRAELTLH